jgi:ABC-type polysaccharide transport system, permease component
MGTKSKNAASSKEIKKLARQRTWDKVKSSKWLYIMLIPGVVYYLIFKYGPMFGLIAAFKDYQPFIGFFRSDWVGFKHFIRFFSDDSFWRLMRNTLSLSLLKLVFYFPAPIIIALLLNEVRIESFKRSVQSIIYVPHFLSWVVVTSITYTLFTTEGGIVNGILESIGIGSINFLSSRAMFRPMIVFQNMWKEAGWGTIIFLAALAGVDVEMYEAARLDGATRIKQIWYITLPAIKSTIITMFILRLGDIMESGFDQVFLMQNAMNRDIADVFDTFVYRTGLVNGQLSYSTAAGLFKSMVGLILVLVADRIAKKVGEEGIL